MIYIKEDEGFKRYYIRADGRLMCERKNGEEEIILSDISNEFDAAQQKGCLHFVLQGAGGEVIYLKKEDGTWRKFDILKSRKGIKKIHKIRLIASENKLCAFYIMEHNGQNLFVKHRFSTDSLYEEPEVMGVCNEGKIYSISQTDNGFILFFKDADGVIKKILLDKDYTIKDIEDCGFKNEILTINTLFYKGITYALCTVRRKNSAALIFFDTDNEADAKIVSFGMAKNCVAEMIASEDEITAIWEENGGIIFSQYIIGNTSFSKPKPLGKGYRLFRIRPCCTSGYTFSGKCAFYNYLPHIPGYNFRKENQNTRRGNNMNSNGFEKNSIKPKDNDIIIEKLKEIEKHIDNMGNTLKDMCSFLDKLTAFKKEADNTCENYDENNIIAEIAGKENLGEINMENVKLFENTDIDSVLPTPEEKQ
ncbi:MAG: hypothetical protein IJN40_03905 [Clostridia bacterium]|nr:hypothetical protein [Clostridia bacterium]